MTQLNSFKAIRYRCFDEFSLPSLSKANLITGPNGIGKTALIEAIWLFSGRYDPRLLWNLNIQRSNISILDPISRLTNDELELSGLENNTYCGVKFEFDNMESKSFSGWTETASVMQDNLKDFPPISGRILAIFNRDGEIENNTLNGIYVSSGRAVMFQSPKQPLERPNSVIEGTLTHQETSTEHLNRFSELVVQGRKQQFVKNLELVAHGVEDAQLVTDSGGKPYLLVTTENGDTKPLHDLGGGAVRLLRMLLGLSAAQNGIFLSDELENGFHHSVQRDIWKKIRQIIKAWNIQFIGTTHSGELIDAAIDVFEDSLDDLSVHHLFRNEQTGKIGVSTFTGEALEGARYLNMEMR